MENHPVALGNIVISLWSQCISEKYVCFSRMTLLLLPLIFTTRAERCLVRPCASSYGLDQVHSPN